MPYLERDGDVFILHLGGGDETENRFHPDWLVQVHALLDQAVSGTGPAALVTTAIGKFYSTGADRDWGADNPGQIDWYLTEIQLLLARMLLLPLPTVAALQGHAFGAGAFFATTHDRIVMRADRGYFCFPGITIGASYSPGIFALVTSRRSAPAAHDALTTGRRYGGDEAHRLGLVDDTAAAEEVLSVAIRHAQSVAHTRGSILSEIKHGLYHQAVAALRTPITGFDQRPAPGPG